MYEIVEKKPVVTYSIYHDATTVRIPCYCILPDGREGFLLNVLKDVVEEGKKKNPYVIMCIDAEKKELEYLVEQLKKNNGKWFDRYSRTYQPFNAKGLSPLEFIKWIKDKGYTFDKSIAKLEKEDERTACFHGNLNEYSCAFRYEIFDAEIINEIITSVPGLNILEPET